jgi:hypothetical protein
MLCRNRQWGDISRVVMQRRYLTYPTAEGFYTLLNTTYLVLPSRLSSALCQLNSIQGIVAVPNVSCQKALYVPLRVVG